MKKLIAIALVFCALLLPTGCDAKQALDDVSNAAQAQGRPSGETYELKQDETMKTAFFDCKVNSVEMRDAFGGYAPSDDTHKFLVVNLSITNTFEDDTSIPMYYDDFELKWDDLGDNTIFPEPYFLSEDSEDEMLPDEYEIFKGESRTGNIVFEVPGDKTEFDLKFYELWSDDFEGNTYFVSLTVGEAA